MLERVRIDGEPVQPSVPEVAELSRQHLVEELLAARPSTGRWRAAVRTGILLGIHGVTSSQLSAISYQLSAISYQLSAVSGQLSAVVAPHSSGATSAMCCENVQ